MSSAVPELATVSPIGLSSRSARVTAMAPQVGAETLARLPAGGIEAFLARNPEFRNALAESLSPAELRARAEQKLIDTVFPRRAVALADVMDRDVKIAATGFSNTPVLEDIYWVYALLKHMETVGKSTDDWGDLRAPSSEAKVAQWSSMAPGLLSPSKLLKALAAMERMGMDRFVHNHVLQNFLTHFKYYVGRVMPTTPPAGSNPEVQRRHYQDQFGNLDQISAQMEKESGRSMCDSLTIGALLIAADFGAALYIIRAANDNQNPGKVAGIGIAVAAVVNAAVVAGIYFLSKYMFPHDRAEFQRGVEAVERLKCYFLAGAHNYEDEASSTTVHTVFEALWKFLQNFETAAACVQVSLPEIRVSATPNAAARSPFSAHHAAIEMVGVGSQRGNNAALMVNPLAIMRHANPAAAAPV